LFVIKYAIDEVEKEKRGAVCSLPTSHWAKEEEASDFPLQHITNLEGSDARATATRASPVMDA